MVLYSNHGKESSSLFYLICSPAVVAFLSIDPDQPIFNIINDVLLRSLRCSLPSVAYAPSVTHAQLRLSHRRIKSRANALHHSVMLQTLIRRTPSVFMSNTHVTKVTCASELRSSTLLRSYRGPSDCVTLSLLRFVSKDDFLLGLCELLKMSLT